MRTLLLLLAFAPTLALADSCRFEAARDLDLPREGARTVAFDLTSADVEVEGVAGLAGVEVRGRACAPTEAALADLIVEQRREGDRVVVVAHERRQGVRSFFGGGSYGLRLKVRVPAELAVRIDSSSGDAHVANVAALDFTTSSGDIVLRDIAGAVKLRLASGDARGDHVGALEVERVSSGDIAVRDIRGDARVGHIGSGDLRLADVHGAVTIEGIGSGDISLSTIERDVTIGPVGSGDVNVDGVGGDLRLAARRDDDDIRYRNVAGKVTFRD